MALEGKRFRRRKKEDIQIEGYFVDHATDVTPGVDRADETHHLYGKDSPETDVQHNMGTLSLTVLDKFTNNAILDLITNQNPDAGGAKQYRAQDLISAHIWANVKDEKNTKYIKSWFLGGWSPGLPLPSGDVNAKAQRVLTGNANLPREFESAWIKMKKVASGGSPTLGGDVPVLVPGESGIYAVAVKAIKDSGGVFEQEDVDVTAAMISGAGAISFAEIGAQASISAPTHAAVYYLQTGTGVYPAVKSDKLRA